MYKRIKACLIRPMDNAQYVNNRGRIFFVYLLIYVLLFSIPYLPTIFNLGSKLASDLKQSMKFQEEVNYIIQDGQLDSLKENNITHVYELDTATIYATYLVIGYDIDEVFRDLKNGNFIHFDKDGIYYRSLMANTSLKMMDYGTDTIDLTKLNDGDPLVFNQLFNYVKVYIDNHLGIVYGIGIPIIFLMNMGWALFICLMMSIMGYLSFRFWGLTFKEAFKISMLSLAPSVLCFMFSIFIERSVISNLLYWGGFIISVIYFYRTTNLYLMNKKKNILRGNQDEL